MEKITLFDFCKFELPLKKKLLIKNNQVCKREGLLINIKTTSGLSGFGEISPLPFFHRESLDDAKLQITELKQSRFFLEKVESLFKYVSSYNPLFYLENTVLKSSEKETTHEAFNKIVSGFLIKLDSIFYGTRIYPSVRTGIEMALISLMFFDFKFEKFIKSMQDPTLKVCRLITDLKKGLKKEILEVISDEFSAVKIKVGRDLAEKEIESIKKIKMLILQNQKNTITLRIDANGLWDIDEAVFFGKAIGLSLIEYIEDPVDNISEFERFYDETRIPVALDEKLLDLIDSNKIIDSGGRWPDYVKAIIIKPDFIGGFFKTACVINFAKKNGIKPVLSNSFNSSLLVSFIALFAEMMDIGDVAMGFDTIKFFSRNLLEEDIEIVKGRINILKIYENIKKINFDLVDSERL
ncbi:MAG: enolase C-terminal domain-like protein [Candidatus Humimicrobiaceae bacterium]